MKIQPALNQSLPASAKSGQKEKPSFSETLKKNLEDVNALQVRAAESSEALALGETDNLHEVMIQTEEARLALELTVQVRNKVVEAYQEIMKMQI